MNAKNGTSLMSSLRDKLHRSTPKKERTPLLKHAGVQTLLSSLLCIVLGLIVGYLALLIINPDGALEAITVIMKNFMKFSAPAAQVKNLGNTLVKTAPLIMCSLSVLFAYKVGLFNIGAAGQYVAGAGAALYCALALQMPWYVCLIAAMVAGALLGVVSGALKAHLNVNEVISCIMLNWIMLYSVNMLLTTVKNPNTPDTLELVKANPAAIIPSLGLETLFKNNKVTIAIPLAVVIAVLIWVLLTKTKLGYELRATGSNKHAAKYVGMREKTNLILTMAIAGGLAGLGAGMYFLSDYQQWNVSQSAVPAMGFNGIAAAFLGGLHPVGAVFSSFFIEHISGGGSFISKSMYFSEISDLISAVIIYLCGFVLFFRGAMTRMIDRVVEAGGWRTMMRDAAFRRRALAVVCAAVVVIGLCAAAMVQTQRVGDLKADVASLNTKLEKANTQKATATEKQKTAEAEKKAAQDELKAVQESLDEALAKLAEYEPLAEQGAQAQIEAEALAAEVAELTAQRDALNTQIEALASYLEQAMESLNSLNPEKEEEGTEE